MEVLWGLNAPENSSFSHIYTAPEPRGAHGKVRVCHNGERRRISPSDELRFACHVFAPWTLTEVRGKLVLRLASLRATPWKRVSLIRGWSLRSSNLWLRLHSHSRGIQRIFLRSCEHICFCTCVCVRECVCMCAVHYCVFDKKSVSKVKNLIFKFYLDSLS